MNQFKTLIFVVINNSFGLSTQGSLFSPYFIVKPFTVLKEIDWKRFILQWFVCMYVIINYYYCCYCYVNKYFFPFIIGFYIHEFFHYKCDE